MRFALLFFFLFIIGIITYVGLTFNESQINTQPHVHEQQTQQPQPTQHELPINKTNKQVFRAYSKTLIWLEKSVGDFCPVDCIIDTSGVVPKDHEDYDAIIWENKQTQMPTEEERKKFVNIYFASESETGVAHRITKNPRDLIDLFGTVFDISMSYHLSSDDIIIDAMKRDRKFVHIPITYSYFTQSEFRSHYLNFSERQQNVSVCAFISNDHGVTNNRSRIFDLLSEFLKIDSFGKYRTNKRAEDLGCKSEDKRCVMRQYKFYLAFENSIDDSYVSEKFFGSLEAGAVPIVFGAPNIDKFDPLYQLNGKSLIQFSLVSNNNKSNLLVEKTTTAAEKESSKKIVFEEFAREINSIANDENEWSQLIKWKQEPIWSSLFGSFFKQSIASKSSACDLCLNIANLKRIKLLNP